MSPFIKRREPSKPVEGHSKRVERKKKSSSNRSESRRDAIKPVVVANPTWGAFRDFWTDCEMTITPYLSGLIDIEGGHIGLSGMWLDSCTDYTFGSSCNCCGRTPSNYLEVRAGDGDGLYSVFELHFEKNAVGALAILDENCQFATEIINSSSAAFDDYQDNAQVLIDFNKGFYEFFYDSIGELDRTLEMHFLGEISAGDNPLYLAGSKTKGILIFGESNEGRDSNQSLVTINNVMPGKYRSFLFANRNADNENILVPRVMLLLEESAAESIGLSIDFANHLNLEEERSLWSKSTVLARIGDPLAPEAILANIKSNFLRLAIASLNEDDELSTRIRIQYLSWLLLLQAHDPSPEREKYLVEELNEWEIALEVIHQARGQFSRRLVENSP
jgi:hypothetical protein